RTEGLGDVVRDDVDGLLFTPGSALELRRALERFADEEFLLDRFELELRAPRTMRSVAREWIDTYRELIEDRAASRPQPQVPAELVALRGRFEDLAQRSTRELMGQVLAGLELLGEQMGLAATPRDFLLSAVGRGSALRDSAAADRRVIERLQRGHERLSQARADLEQRSSWHTSQLAELRERLEERAAALQARGQEAMQARRARDELAQAKEADAEERSRLEGELAERLSAIAGLEQELDTTRGAHDRLEEERVALARTLAESAQELRFLRELALGDEDDDALSDREVVEAHLTSLERELGGLRDHEQWLRRELGGLVEVLTKVSDTMAQARPDEQGLNAGRDGLERIVRELGWRRGEMAAAREASKRWFTRLAGGELATRIQGWQEGEA
ncbi:MAG: hypothetical protein O2816_19845, partial [Planctomycetota bacterium]|nr:hypothetical protein [Planctomycetota bacterium]